jgi:hypothetical protein
MRDTELFSEGHEIIGRISPQSSSTAQNTGYLALGKHSRYVAIIQIGATAATATVDAKLQYALDGSGTGVTDITGKAITQILAATDDVDRMIELRTDELPEGATHIRLVVTCATAASLISAVVLGVSPYYKPVTIPTTLVVTN